MENIVGMDYKVSNTSYTGESNVEGTTKKEVHYYELLVMLYSDLLKLSNWMKTQTSAYKQKYVSRYQAPELEKILNYSNQVEIVANEVRRRMNHIRMSKSIDLEDTPIFKSVLTYQKQ